MSSNFTIKDLLEAGVHYGHVAHKWNPKMAPYIFGKRNGVHIINLDITVPMLENAINVIRDVSSNNGRILFVGTKSQASERIKAAAIKCGQYYVNNRWLGGMLTNWKTVSQSIKKMQTIEGMISKSDKYTKREISGFQREFEKLESAIGGIVKMGDVPDLLVVIDTIRESIAIGEAVKLGIPVVAVVDSNSDPDNITYPIPGNDDATKAIDLYCDLFSSAVIEGMQKGMQKLGIDLGASQETPVDQK